MVSRKNFNPLRAIDRLRETHGQIRSDGVADKSESLFGVNY